MATTLRRRRRSVRLPAYDYRQPGAYFITVVTRGRACYFGDVVAGAMRLGPEGEIIQRCWLAIPQHTPRVTLDAFVVMPNHVHGILWIQGIGPHVVGAQHAAPLPRGGATRYGVPPGSLGAIVRSFKSASTRAVNGLHGTPGAALWQRNYHEHIVRSDEDLATVRRYISDNPLQWALDEENPRRV